MSKNLAASIVLKICTKGNISMLLVPFIIIPRKTVMIVFKQRERERERERGERFLVVLEISDIRAIQTPFVTDHRDQSMFILVVLI